MSKNAKTAAAQAAALITSAKESAKSEHEARGIAKRGGADYFVFPQAIIVKDGWNDRFDWGDIEELAQQIKAEKVKNGHGLLNKLRVKRTGDPQVFELIDGERRLRAIQLLMERGEVWENGVPVWIEAKDADNLELMAKKILANGGKNFLPLEEASAYQKMRKEGATIERICELVGRAHTHVRAVLALLDAAPELQDAVREGKIGSSVAKEIATVARGDQMKQRALTQKAVTIGKNSKNAAAREELEEALRAEKAEKAAKKGKVLKTRVMPEEKLRALGERLGKLLEAKVREADMQKLLAAGVDVLLEEIRKDEKMVAAYTLGAFQALGAASGVKINLDI